MNGALIFQSGPPLSWGNVVYLGGPLDWNPHPQNPLTPGATMNTAEFYTASSLQPSDGIRTFDTYFNNLRRDPTKNADLSLLKKFQLREKMYLQLRFEGFNITNRVGFNAPVSLSPTNASFSEYHYPGEHTAAYSDRGAHGVVSGLPWLDSPMAAAHPVE